MGLRADLYAYKELKARYRNAATRLAELEAAAGSVGSAPMDGMPRGSFVGQPTEKKALRVVEQEEITVSLGREMYRAEKDLTERINTIPDARIRLLLTLHYLRGFSWTKTADWLSNNRQTYTRDSEKNYANRFLEVYDNDTD